ncbi:MAG: aminopeptidase [Deinococcales bacterium]
MQESFQEHLKDYAELIIKVGINLQKGQRLLIRAPLEAKELVRELHIAAYRVGSPLVNSLFQDEELGLIRFQHAPRDSFEIINEAYVDTTLAAIRRGDAVISVIGGSPDLLKGQDPELIAKASQSYARYAKPVSELITKNAVQWCVVAMPSEPWARKVFPDKAPQEAVEALWQAIFSSNRLFNVDPVALWREHSQNLAARCDYLNSKNYEALIYKGEKTNLTLGLAEGHIWQGGGAQTKEGLSFIPNLPTEEIFTAPHRFRVEGVVGSSKHLSHGGQLIEDFSLEFKDGKAIKVSAKNGEAALQKLIESDEGAARLGEVALVPHSSPISQMNLLFLNTLFDENAASHLALGEAYKHCVKGGEDEALFASAGGNKSIIHVDFMIGAADLDIDGLRGGRLEPVMRQGEWAFEV